MYTMQHAINVTIFFLFNSTELTDFLKGACRWKCFTTYLFNKDLVVNCQNILFVISSLLILSYDTSQDVCGSRPLTNEKRRWTHQTRERTVMEQHQPLESSIVMDIAPTFFILNWESEICQHFAKLVQLGKRNPEFLRYGKCNHKWKLNPPESNNLSFIMKQEIIWIISLISLFKEWDFSAMSAFLGSIQYQGFSKNPDIAVREID
jgi:hypothetical protein